MKPAHENFLRTPLHVADDLNQNLAFVASVLSTSFARALLGFIL